MITQKEISLPPFPRGWHLITDQVERVLADLPETGILHIFIKHTSAGLALNENADPTARHDLEVFMDDLVSENNPTYTHTLEGTDDMPAHIKSVLTGHTLTIPISKGRLNLGTWQGIYLCEFRDRGGSRKLVLTVIS
ncbi:MAG: secondary thiamine-phosphate synthase enzyme YjbQ [Flavobacteriales bacterium]|nr:secondary thiamine-phosphate synthase enzyme YjbQ [Flavobacteriales bacterium]